MQKGKMPCMEVTIFIWNRVIACWQEVAGACLLLY